MFAQNGTAAHRGRPGAVSYTHLDVYKRQDLLFGTLAKLLIDVDEQRDGRRQNGEHHHHVYDDEQHLAAMQFSIPRPHVFYSRSSP